MKLTNILLFTFVFATTTSSFAQMQLSLKDAIQYAMQNNISIKNSQINIADAEARIYENRATGLPQVSAGLDWQTFFLLPKVALPASFSSGTGNAVFKILNGYGVKDRNGNDIPLSPPVDPDASKEPVKISFQQRHSVSPSISASQLVYSGSYNVARRAARDYRDLVQKQLLAKQNEVKNQVIDAYLPALLITESVKTFDKNITNLEKLLSETKAFNKEGFVENLDVDRLTLSLENIKTQRANVARSKELIVNALRFIIGAKNSEIFELKDDLTSLLSDVSQADLEGEINYAKRPEYNLILQGEKMQQLQIDLAKASTLPTVATFASFSYGFQGNSFKKDDYFFLPTGVVGAKVSVPIWGGGGLPYTKQRAVLALETVKNQRIEFENAVQLQAKNARISYSNAKINLASQEKNLGLAEKIYNISKTKYKEGIGSSVEIIQAESTLYQNQQNIIQAKYDLLKAKIDLDKALGN
jgi:outer membrane protein